MKNSFKIKLIRTIIGIGLLFALLSALEPHLVWLAKFCGHFGDGCRDTHAFKLFTIPIAYLGIVFYLVLITASFFKSREPLFWLIMGGFGFEILLVELMFRHQFFCVFCILNLVVMLLLIGLVFHQTKIWQTASACLFTYVFWGFFIHQPALTGGNNASEFKTDEVAAIVADVPILDKEIEAPIAGRLYLLQKDIFLLKRRQLDALVQKRLVEIEARNQGISPNELSAKIIENAQKVTIADVDAYYYQNLDKLSDFKKNTPEIKQQVEAYLVNVNRDKAIQDYIMLLFEKYDVTDMYQPPKLPTANVDIKDSPSWGPFDAKVTIVEFSDYLCPSCRKTHAITKKIKEKYKGQIRWIFKDYPLPKHKGADYLAMAARCAGDQNKFWEFQDILFNYIKTNISRDDLMNDAVSLELDVDRFALCLDTKRYFSAVQKDMKDVESAGLNTTPTFIINGKVHPGAPDEQTFSEMIEKDL